jgi:hypothetical protein
VPGVVTLTPEQSAQELHRSHPNVPVPFLTSL